MHLFKCLFPISPITITIIQCVKHGNKKFFNIKTFRNHSNTSINRGINGKSLGRTQKNRSQSRTNPKRSPKQSQRNNQSLADKKQKNLIVNSKTYAEEEAQQLYDRYNCRRLTAPRGAIERKSEKPRETESASGKTHGTSVRAVVSVVLGENKT